jgi:lantibiotic modifying enzyme
VTHLETAVTIGKEIADAAIWHSSRCTWVGAMPEEGAAGPRMTYTSFGPDLYGGTAGVALVLAELYAASGESLVLAELYAASGESLFQAVALGAIEHARSRAGDLPPGASLGAYTGRPGVALAAVLVGRPREDRYWTATPRISCMPSPTPASRLTVSQKDAGRAACPAGVPPAFFSASPEPPTSIFA